MTERNAPSAAERPPSIWHRHDLIVVAAAAVLFAAGAAAHARLVEPDLIEFSRDGLSVRRPGGLLPPAPVPPAASPLARLADGGDGGPHAPAFHQRWSSPDGPLMAFEVRIAPRPAFRGLGVVLQAERAARYGDMVWVADSRTVELGGTQWLRSEFRYAVKPTEWAAPQIATGIEYAAVNGDRLYVVTAHGTPEQARYLERVALSTLRLGPGGQP
ncbi:MAG: hypothetical protein D6689_02885 [Deltaproteobacteria bacterium]|nr:MAG: hypothetical protein D6689_02885 [Deltaproteobacteria bacterium]